jgi:hypothetical protein
LYSEAERTVTVTGAVKLVLQPSVTMRRYCVVWVMATVGVYVDALLLVMYSHVTPLFVLYCQ